MTELVRVLPQGDSVAIWVPKGIDEQSVQKVAEGYMAKGTRVIIYRSGESSLVDVTASLLKANIV